MTRTRDGRPVTIRPYTEDDVYDLVAMNRALVDEGVGQVRLASDLPETDEAYAAQLHARGKGRCWWVAELDGRVVASASVNTNQASLVRHLGWFEIGVHPDAQGIGIGLLLTLAVLESARRRGVERVELGVRADNPRAIRLYERVGFEHEAMRRGYIKLPDGSYVDDLCMVKWLVPAPA